MITTIHSRTAEYRVRDLLLCMLTVSSGAVDAISFLALGKVFTAFMTGNIAFLGMRVAGAAAAPDALNIVASMAGFAAGVYLGTRIAKPTWTRIAKPTPDNTAVWPQRVTLALGLSLIVHASFVAVWFTSNGIPSVGATPYLLGLWGLAMGIQTAAVRTLNVGGVFTTAATATFVYAVGDIANRPATAAEGWRLVGVLVSLFVGAAVGGIILLDAPIYAPAFPLAITVAVVATAAIAGSSQRYSPQASAR